MLCGTIGTLMKHGEKKAQSTSVMLVSTKLTQKQRLNLKPLVYL